MESPEVRPNILQRTLFTAIKHPGALVVDITEGVVLGIAGAAAIEGHPLPVSDFLSVAKALNELGLPFAFVAEVIKWL